MTDFRNKCDITISDMPMNADYDLFLPEYRAQLDQRGTQSVLVQTIESDYSEEEFEICGTYDSLREENLSEFMALRAKNSEVIAWLSVPSTGISCPIMQSRESDDYYLYHDAERGTSSAGSVYMELANSNTFTDQVTVLYGYSFSSSEEGLTRLHYLENSEFFEAADELYIYLPDKILSYQIVAAYVYDSRHILNSFDFDNPSVLSEYYDYVVNPNTQICQVRQGVDLEVSDHVLQLSTCTVPARADARYLVTAKLTSQVIL